MASQDMFGFQLLHKIAEREIQRKEDVIILLSHWFLLKNGFECVGVGDSKEVTGNEEKTESLPQGWNSTNEYRLRYLSNNKMFLLRATSTDGDLIINFLRAQDSVISSVIINIEETVNNTSGAIEVLIPTYENLLEKLKKELIAPIKVESPKSATSSTQTPDSMRRSSSTLPSLITVSRPNVHNIIPPMSIYDYGRRDLSPYPLHPGLGGGGGGMIFDPFQNNPLRNMRPGPAPPGSRYDPIFPGGREPDPDHLRRPGPRPDPDMFL